MLVEHRSHRPSAGWNVPLDRARTPDLVLVFGPEAYLGRMAPFEDLARAFPGAVVAGCASGCSIQGEGVDQSALLATLVDFTASSVVAVSERVDFASSRDVGRRLAEALPREGLRHVLVFADGRESNGVELAAGLVDSLGNDVPVAGGLSGEADYRVPSWVVADGMPRDGVATAVGFYGAVRAVSGHKGGWAPFGLERTVTQSVGAEVYEIDGRPALELYQEYLGDRAAELPASGALFPMLVLDGEGGLGLILSVAGTSQSRGSVRFTGPVSEGTRIQMMTASQDRLIEAAGEVATACRQEGATLALVISCAGREQVLGNRVEEEVFALLPEGCAVTGFYSFGELSPEVPGGAVRLHGLTMTLTTYVERFEP